MAFDKFLIAPFNSGLDTSLKPFLIPDDAFQVLQNAYCFRGRIKKRWGSVLMTSTTTATNIDQLVSRLRVNVGTTDGSGNFGPTIVPTGSTGAIWKIGQMFSVGNTMFTVHQATGSTFTTGAATATFNTTNGTLQIIGNSENPNTDIWFYPAEPVMGITTFENGPVNNQPSYAFDTRFVYVFNTSAGWSRSGSGVTPIWHGTDLDFFWVCNWQQIPGTVGMFVTNDYVVNPNGAVTAQDDPIWILNSSTGSWTTFQPIFLVAGNYVQTCRLIFVFHGSLLLINTIEVDSTGTTNKEFKNRCRYSALGDPTDTFSYYENTQAGFTGGGVFDAPTDEAAITGEFIKDRLIIYFERSTYEIVYTGNSLQPFRFQKLNSELGCESTFSVIPFDDGVLGIGATGVHSCNGSNVSRIDNTIPDLVFDIRNANSAIERVAGIRDYFNELVYWAYPSDNDGSVYPNKILVYNYRNQTWSQFDDSVTTWGYFEQSVGPTWANANSTWQNYEGTWNSGVLQSEALQIMGGNQQGWTFLVQTKSGTNAPVLQITDATISSTFVLTLKIYDHNLEESDEPTFGDYIYISGCQGSVNLNGLTLPVNEVLGKDTVNFIMPTGFTLGGTYSGGGSASRVSNIQILSKQWNPYDKDGSNIALGRIDFAVTKTSRGEVVVDYYPSSSYVSMVQSGSSTGAIMGTSVLETFPYDPKYYPLEQYQERLWHPVYFQTSGECIQIAIYMNDIQMRNRNISSDFFEIQGLVLWTSRASGRLQ